MADTSKQIVANDAINVSRRGRNNCQYVDVNKKIIIDKDNIVSLTEVACAVYRRVYVHKSLRYIDPRRDTIMPISSLHGQMG